MNVPALGLRRRFRVVGGPTPLSALVPLARRLSGAISDAAARRHRVAGQAVRCSRGCSACCHYMVPISSPEAIFLAREIQAVDAYARNRLLERFVSACRMLLEGTPPGGPVPADMEQLSQWYAGLDLPCPLLDSSSCSLYDSRPLACREHVVLSPPELCRGHRPRCGTRLDLPVRLADVIYTLWQELDGGCDGAVLLPLVPAWYQDHLGARESTWPAEQLLARLAEVLSRNNGVRAWVVQRH